MIAPEFRFHLPHERLRPYLRGYLFGDFEGGPPVDDYIYPEWGHIRVATSGDWILRLGDTVLSTSITPVIACGPSSRPIKAMAVPPTRTVSIGLMPLGWARLFGLSAEDFADRLRPMVEVRPDVADCLLPIVRGVTDDAALCVMLDDLFLSLEAAGPPISPLMARACALVLDEEIRTAELFAASLGRSARQLSRLSREIFGFPPKLLLRRQRFLRSLLALRLNPGMRSSLVIDKGYYDHSHFIRDFHRFMGMSPRQYFTRPHPLMDEATSVIKLDIGATPKAA